MSITVFNLVMYTTPITQKKLVNVYVRREILNTLGMPSRLQTNLHKSSIISIRCEEAYLSVVSNLPYHISEFPCTYLGLYRCLTRN
jgi:hypothetical protein